MQKWFANPANRSKIYQSARAVAPLLVIFGITSQGTTESILNVIGALLLFGTNHVANQNVK